MMLDGNPLDITEKEGTTLRPRAGGAFGAGLSAVPAANFTTDADETSPLRAASGERAAEAADME